MAPVSVFSILFMVILPSSADAHHILQDLLIVQGWVKHDENFAFSWGQIIIWSHYDPFTLSQSTTV